MCRLNKTYPQGLLRKTSFLSSLAEATAAASQWDLPLWESSPGEQKSSNPWSGPSCQACPTCLRRKSSGVETASHLLCVPPAQRLGQSTTGVVIRQWLSTLTHRPQGHRRPAGGVSPSFCMPLHSHSPRRNVFAMLSSNLDVSPLQEDILKTSAFPFSPQRPPAFGDGGGCVCVAAGR